MTYSCYQLKMGFTYLVKYASSKASLYRDVQMVEIQKCLGSRKIKIFRALSKQGLRAIDGVSMGFSFIYMIHHNLVIRHGKINRCDNLR